MDLAYAHMKNLPCTVNLFLSTETESKTRGKSDVLPVGISVDKGHTAIGRSGHSGRVRGAVKKSFIPARFWPESAL
jgi:hypothetical protein